MSRMLAASIVASSAYLAAGSAFQCYSDVELGPVRNQDRKGLCVDDATLRGCPSKIPGLWPNAATGVSSLRLFKAWDPEWPDDDRMSTWEQLRDFAEEQNAKILIGTRIGCDPLVDMQDWTWVKELMGMIGEKHVMGVAIGNELDILHSKVQVSDNSVNANCISDLWAGDRYWKEFQKRVKDLDNMGLSSVPVTAVFTGAVIGTATPFIDTPNAMVNAFLTKAVNAYGPRFVFTFNFYPYFDPNFPLDAGTTDQCNASLKVATCFQNGCNVPNMVGIIRNKMQQLTGGTSSLLWVGETGWSSPSSDTLTTRMSTCAAWSSEASLKDSYAGFMGWDLSSPGGSIPDHAFYFTTRDSNNFGMAEHFGLMSKCWGTFCKLRSPGYTGPSAEVIQEQQERDRLTWLSQLWLGAAAGSFGLIVCGAGLARWRSSRREADQEEMMAAASSA